MKRLTASILLLLLAKCGAIAQQNKLIYTGEWSNNKYCFSKNDVAIQEKLQHEMEEAIVSKSSDEWDVNVSECWSITYPSYSKQPFCLIEDSARKHFMMCSMHIEFYPKSGTKMMEDYLKRQQKSIDDQNKVRKDLTDKIISPAQASEQYKKLDADVWGAPVHLYITTNDFSIGDSSVISIQEPSSVFACAPFKTEGVDYAMSCMETLLSGTYHVTFAYLGDIATPNSKVKLSKPKSLQWEKQNLIKIKIYAPDDVALRLMKNFDWKKIKSVLE